MSALMMWIILFMCVIHIIAIPTPCAVLNSTEKCTVTAVCMLPFTQGYCWIILSYLYIFITLLSLQMYEKLCKSINLKYESKNLSRGIHIFVGAQIFTQALFDYYRFRLCSDLSCVQAHHFARLVCHPDTPKAGFFCPPSFVPMNAVWQSGKYLCCFVLL